MEINLNLIPPYKKDAITRGKRLRMVVRIELAIIFFMLMLFAYLYGIIHLLDYNLNAVSGNAGASGEKSKYEEIARYDSKFKDINAKTIQIEKIKKDQFYWSGLFVNLSQSILSGISIENVATKEYAVFLVGKADSRDNLIAFKEKLGKNSCFSNVNLPLSDLVSKGNIDFQMDLEIKKECLNPAE
jgi:hypothetical protein